MFGEIRTIFDRIVLQGGVDHKADDLVFVNLGNFRDRIIAAIRASGLERWEKLFLNLRSSCITDMVERRCSEKFLDAMFGNSARVRSLHYIQFRRDREYAKVLQEDAFLHRKSVETVGSIDLDSLSHEEILVLRDFLVNRFGVGKQVG